MISRLTPLAALAAALVVLSGCAAGIERRDDRQDRREDRRDDRRDFSGQPPSDVYSFVEKAAGNAA